ISFLCVGCCSTIETGTKHTSNQRMDLARGQSVERFPYIWPTESMAGSANRELATGPAHYSDIAPPYRTGWSQAPLEFGYLKAETSAKLVQLPFCAKSNGLATYCLRITAAP